MEEARDYQLAEHLIAHLMQDEEINIEHTFRFSNPTYSDIC